MDQNLDLDQLRERWHREVYQKARQVDPDEYYVWDGVLLGFLLGAGLSLATAKRAMRIGEWKK